jgi:hydrogenase maturation protease
MRILVIGYGNNHRRDDGVGWFVVKELAAAIPGVDCRTLHQLEVDLAEDLAVTDAVIFIDAAIPESRQAVERREIAPRLESHAVAHYLTPADLLALSVTLYGHQPRAILFSIRGRDFNFGTELSPEVEQEARRVVRNIQELIPLLERTRTAHA